MQVEFVGRVIIGKSGVGRVAVDRHGRQYRFAVGERIVADGDRVVSVKALDDQSREGVDSEVVSLEPADRHAGVACDASGQVATIHVDRVVRVVGTNRQGAARSSGDHNRFQVIEVDRETLAGIIGRQNFALGSTGISGGSTPVAFTRAVDLVGGHARTALVKHEPNRVTGGGFPTRVEDHAGLAGNERVVGVTGRHAPQHNVLDRRQTTAGGVVDDQRVVIR